jgi:acetylornithine deacetylase/succinyl-diaminopimelate desuccinylase-like protein
MVTAEQKELVLSKIRGEELAQLVLKLVQTESPSGQEKAVGDTIYSWLENEGFSPRRVGMLPHRFNVAGILRGKGDGCRLLFNAHMDTAPPRESNPKEAMWLTGWQERNRLYGAPVMNDKGPMACFMVAAKAIKDSGVELAGDLILTMVCAEIGRQPFEDILPSEQYGREVGARWLATHGPYAYADYALVAEATGGTCTWVECGEAHFKVTIKTERPVYMPHLTRTPKLEESQNAVVRAAPYIQAFERWAEEVYEKRWRYEFKGGTVIPKAGIGAIKGGDPTLSGGTPDVCQIFLCFFTPPKIDLFWIERQLVELGRSVNVPVEVEMYTFVPGHEGQGIEPMVDVIGAAHQEIFGDPMKPVPPPVTSMWRDVNVFNELGIPSVTYGPGASTGMSRIERM